MSSIISSLIDTYDAVCTSVLTFRSYLASRTFYSVGSIICYINIYEIFDTIRFLRRAPYRSDVSDSNKNLRYGMAPFVVHAKIWCVCFSYVLVYSVDIFQHASRKAI